MGQETHGESSSRPSPIITDTNSEHGGPKALESNVFVSPTSAEELDKFPTIVLQDDDTRSTEPLLKKQKTDQYDEVAQVHPIASNAGTPTTTTAKKRKATDNLDERETNTNVIPTDSGIASSQRSTAGSNGQTAKKRSSILRFLMDSNEEGLPSSPALTESSKDATKAPPQAIEAETSDPREDLMESKEDEEIEDTTTLSSPKEHLEPNVADGTTADTSDPVVEQSPQEHMGADVANGATTDISEPIVEHPSETKEQSFQPPETQLGGSSPSLSSESVARGHGTVEEEVLEDNTHGRPAEGTNNVEDCDAPTDGHTAELCPAQATSPSINPSTTEASEVPEPVEPTVSSANLDSNGQSLDKSQDLTKASASLDPDKNEAEVLAYLDEMENDQEPILIPSLLQLADEPDASAPSHGDAAADDATDPTQSSELAPLQSTDSNIIDSTNADTSNDPPQSAHIHDFSELPPPIVLDLPVEDSSNDPQYPPLFPRDEAPMSSSEGYLSEASNDGSSESDIEVPPPPPGPFVPGPKKEVISFATMYDEGVTSEPLPDVKDLLDIPDDATLNQAGLVDQQPLPFPDSEPLLAAVHDFFDGGNDDKNNSTDSSSSSSSSSDSEDDAEVPPPPPTSTPPQQKPDDNVVDLSLTPPPDSPLRLQAKQLPPHVYYNEPRREADEASSDSSSSSDESSSSNFDPDDDDDDDNEPSSKETPSLPKPASTQPLRASQEREETKDDATAQDNGGVESDDSDVVIVGVVPAAPPPVPTEFLNPVLRGTYEVGYTEASWSGTWGFTETTDSAPTKFSYRCVNENGKWAMDTPKTGFYDGFFYVQHRPHGKPQKIAEKRVFIEFTEVSSRMYMVDGQGKNKFGAFQLKGYFEWGEKLTLEKVYAS
ncbi:hypothetical protein LEN26_001507 [Aphanomyces euteiches]|nr:hypothetical protein AeMF1_004758 [Aphanomyces euteiches]KAH9161256.1 hypothetical protein LEN26_001507 [Aphanomyces euteiches]